VISNSTADGRKLKKQAFHNCIAIDALKRLSSTNAKSARNEHDIILKIPIDVAFGLPVRAETPGFDTLLVGRTLHKTLDFQICDRQGNVIQTLYDPIVSFILVLYG
jgi:hypothetical protein